jgi:hypothetical protein
MGSRTMASQTCYCSSARKRKENTIGERTRTGARLPRKMEGPIGTEGRPASERNRARLWLHEREIHNTSAQCGRTPKPSRLACHGSARQMSPVRAGTKIKDNTQAGKRWWQQNQKPSGTGPASWNENLMHRKPSCGDRGWARAKQIWREH